MARIEHRGCALVFTRAGGMVCSHRDVACCALLGHFHSLMARKPLAHSLVVRQNFVCAGA
eukprot:scaffold112852_cov19-Tisochrysis_lutea.AAC.1